MTHVVRGQTVVGVVVGHPAHVESQLRCDSEQRGARAVVVATVEQGADLAPQVGDSHRPGRTASVGVVRRLERPTYRAQPLYVGLSDAALRIAAGGRAVSGGDQP